MDFALNCRAPLPPPPPLPHSPTPPACSPTCVRLSHVYVEEDEDDSAELQPPSGESTARDPRPTITAPRPELPARRQAAPPPHAYSSLSALTKIGINSFTGLFRHFRREIISYLTSNVGSRLAVVYWVLHGVVLLRAAVYWTSKLGLQAV